MEIEIFFSAFWEFVVLPTKNDESMNCLDLLAIIFLSCRKFAQ